MESLCYNIFMKTDETFTELSQRLRDIRKEKGYTQIKLAKISGVSRRMIGHYETNVIRPSIDKVKKLAETLDVSLDELLGITPKKKKKKEEDVSYKIMKKVRVIEELPTRDQNMIFSLINSLVEKNKLKKKK